MKPIYRGEPGFSSTEQINDAFLLGDFAQTLHPVLETDAADEALDESMAHLEHIYHLARSGVEIEHAGYEGRSLALYTALKLESVGHEVAADWVDDIFMQRVAEGLANPDNTGSALDAVNAAHILYDRHYPNGLELLAQSVASLEDREPWFGKFSVVTEENGQDHATRSLMLECHLYRTLLRADIALAENDIAEHGNMFMAYTAYVRAGREVLASRPYASDVSGIYNDLKDMYQSLHDIIGREFDLDTPTVPLWHRLADFTSSKATEARIAALNALADLRERDPSDRKLRRKASAIASQELSSLLFGRDDDEKDMQLQRALDRVRRGTSWDIMGALDSWMAVQETTSRLENMPTYMGRCALDVARR